MPGNTLSTRERSQASAKPKIASSGRASTSPWLVAKTIPLPKIAAQSDHAGQEKAEAEAAVGRLFDEWRHSRDHDPVRGVFGGVAVQEVLRHDALLAAAVQERVDDRDQEARDQERRHREPERFQPAPWGAQGKERVAQLLPGRHAAVRDPQNDA